MEVQRLGKNILNTCLPCSNFLSTLLTPRERAKRKIPPKRRAAPSCTRAKRLNKEEAAAGQWAALLSLPEEQSQQEGITTEDLNKICNKGLKLMLSEDTNGLMQFQDELNIIGSTFTDNDNKPGALFIYVLWMMCDHTIVDQTTALEGVYLDAFRRVFDILEDSGWSLVREKDKAEANEPGLDGLPSLPYMQEI